MFDFNVTLRDEVQEAKQGPPCERCKDWDEQHSLWLDEQARLCAMIDAAERQRDELQEAMNDWRDRARQTQITLTLTEAQRDEYKVALEQFLDPDGNPPEDTGEWREVLRVLKGDKA